MALDDSSQGQVPKKITPLDHFHSLPSKDFAPSKSSLNSLCCFTCKVQEAGKKLGIPKWALHSFETRSFPIQGHCFSFREKEFPFLYQSLSIIVLNTICHSVHFFRKVAHFQYYDSVYTDSDLTNMLSDQILEKGSLY